jgi:hypothetical protein
MILLFTYLFPVLGMIEMFVCCCSVCMFYFKAYIVVPTVWNKVLTTVPCLCFIEQTDRMQDDTDRVFVPLLVPDPEENRLVMAVIQKYTDQAHSSSHHRMSYNKG